jgi:hypothetical protein
LYIKLLEGKTIHTRNDSLREARVEADKIGTVIVNYPIKINILEKELQLDSITIVKLNPNYDSIMKELTASPPKTVRHGQVGESYMLVRHLRIPKDKIDQYYKKVEGVSQYYYGNL